MLVQTNLSGGFDNIYSYEISSGKEGNSIYLLLRNRSRNWFSVGISSDIEGSRYMNSRFSQITNSLYFKVMRAN